MKSTLAALALFAATADANPPTPKERAAFAMVSYLASLDAKRPAHACKVKSESCDSSCAKLPAESLVFVETCTMLAGCAATSDCLASAIGGRSGFASCATFAETAARIAKRPKAVAALEKECERDVLRYPELVCVASAPTVAELALCFLTINRNNVRELLQ